MAFGLHKPRSLNDMHSPVVLPIPLTGVTAVAGTWAATLSSTNCNAGYLQNDATSANADNFTYPFYAPAGVYSIYVNVIKDSDTGKIDVSVDGTKWISASDTYAASAAQVVVSATGKSMKAGVHTLTVAVNGKNDSSTDYILNVGFVTLVRTS